MSRREFLVLGGAGLARTIMPGIARCGGREEGRAEKAGSEQEEPESLQGEGETLEIPTGRGTVRGILYPTKGMRGAVVMVGGAGGDITGPSGVYEELAVRLQTEDVTALRLEYRMPNELEDCVYDLLAGVREFGKRGIERISPHRLVLWWGGGCKRGCGERPGGRGGDGGRPIVWGRGCRGVVAREEPAANTRHRRRGASLRDLAKPLRESG